MLHEDRARRSAARSRRGIVSDLEVIRERQCHLTYPAVNRAQFHPPQGDRKVKVWVEKTFRGRTLEKPVEICSTSYKADYLLVPKEQEATVCRPLGEPIAERILPQTVDMPPLLREFVERETGQRNPQLPIIIKPNREKIARLARDGETPNVSVSMDLGKPISPRLYKGLDV